MTISGDTPPPDDTATGTAPVEMPEAAPSTLTPPTPDSPPAAPDLDPSAPDLATVVSGGDTTTAAAVAADAATPVDAAQTSLDPAPATLPPAPVVTGLSYAVDIVFCIDVTGSMSPIIDAVKTNAMRFYDDVQTNLTDKGKNVDELRVRVIAFRDFAADGEAALEESDFFTLPGDQAYFSEFVGGLTAQGGGDAPESGLEAIALAMNSPWTMRGDRRRQVIVVWTDQAAQPLGSAGVPASVSARVPADFSALTDLWEDTQGPLGSSSKRLILFAPDGPGWSDISGVWENVVHHPSRAGGGLSDVDYGTIVDSIGNSV